jgi:predicted ArsR family transcriptional regulator
VHAGFSDNVERLAVLDDPVRRRIYVWVRGERRAVTREEVAAGADVSRNLAAFHLDKLVERGLLVAAYGRPEGGGGPGSGRPPKRYELADVDLTVSLPERRYDLVGGVLARVVDSSGRGVRQRAVEYAREEGVRTGEAWAGRRRPSVASVLAELGFEPTTGDGEEVVLTNCPFHAMVDTAPSLVCGLNHAFNEGLLEGLGLRDVEAVLEPGSDRCCVVLRPRR